MKVDKYNKVLCYIIIYSNSVAYPRILWGGGGVKKIQLRTEDRENGDLGAVAPSSGVLEAAVILYKNFYFIWQNFIIFCYFSIFMTTTNLFVIANVKQLRTG
jgi:hypothetical protein